MNKREAAIISAYTGLSFGADLFVSFQKYVEEKFERGVWPHEMTDEKFWALLKALSKQDFMDLIKETVGG